MNNRRRRGDKVALIIQSLTAIIASAALVISLITFSDQINQIQEERARSAVDTCQVLRTLIFTATPPGREQQAKTFLKRVGLTDCIAFGDNVIHPPKEKP